MYPGSEIFFPNPLLTVLDRCLNVSMGKNAKLRVYGENDSEFNTICISSSFDI